MPAHLQASGTITCDLGVSMGVAGWNGPRECLGVASTSQAYIVKARLTELRIRLRVHQGSEGDPQVLVQDYDYILPLSSAYFSG